MWLVIISAVLGIIAFLPYNFYFLGFLYLVPLFIFFFKESRLWRLLLGVFLFRLFFGLGTIYQTFEPLTWILSILIFLGLPLSIFLVKKLVSVFNFSPLTLYLALPFLWTLWEFLQARYSFLPTYIINAGSIFGSSPFLGLAKIGGLVSLTFFAALINTLIAIFILKIKKIKVLFLILYLLFIIFILIAAWQISSFQLQKNTTAYHGHKNSLKIGVISASPEFDGISFQELRKKLIERKDNIELLIFPENILDNLSEAEYFYLWKNLAQELNADLIVTFPTSQNQEKYNSTIFFDKNGEVIDIYHKNFLSFVGEYWPFGDWRPFYFQWLKNANPALEDYAVFKPENTLSRGTQKLLNGKFAPTICLEIHYPFYLKNYKKMGAEFIVNPTSNRWLDIGTDHFLYLMNNLRKIYSVWLNLPIIISGIKDFAGLITPDGKISTDNNLFIGEIKF